MWSDRSCNDEPRNPAEFTKSLDRFYTRFARRIYDVAVKLEAGPLRVVSTDSSGNIRRSTYEVSPGVRVTLVESPVEAARERAVAAPGPEAGRAAGVTPGRIVAATAPPVTNSISWVDRGRRYTLTGPLPQKELEAIKLRLMKMRE